MLADHFNESADTAVNKVELFEKQVKEQFVNDPGQMRLLIVVDKLLTGFDAPSATYLYLDKKMQDHGLFQAICRVNRLDGDDKEYGYIVDYRDLFNSLESAITDYTGGALDGYEKKDIEGLLANRVDEAHEDLDEALEQIRALCEPVEPPENTLQYQRYFCAREQGDAEQLKANEPKRVELYKAIARLTRAYANLANEMEAAGYSDAEAVAIKAEVAHYASVRDEVKLGAGEDVDFKLYEAGMRHLLDTYVSADLSQVIADFGDAGLIELIAQLGSGAIDKLPKRIKDDPEAVAETVTNNIRTVIVDERPLNPKYYDRMSELLDAILEQRRQGSLDYEEYLAKLLEHATKLGKEESETEYPAWADNGGRRALIDFFAPQNDLAVEVDKAVLRSKPDSWVGAPLKERKVRRAIKANLPADFGRLDELFELVRARDEYR
jgi:type I restriction enzyme R subunit